MKRIADHLILARNYVWQKFLNLMIILAIVVGFVVVVCGGFALLVVLIPLFLAAIVSKLHGNELIQVVVVLCYYIPIACYFTRTEERSHYIHL